MVPKGCCSSSGLRRGALLLAMLAAMLAGCTGAGPSTVEQPGAALVQNGSGVFPAEQLGSPFPLPSPSQVQASQHAKKRTSAVLSRDASDFVTGFSQHVKKAAPSALFAPEWADGYSAFDTVAYAVYQFDLTKRSGNLEINTQWVPVLGDFKLLWIGASNWERDRWDWRCGAPSGVLNLGLEGMARYKHPETGELYVAVVLLGQTDATLRKVWIDCSKRGDWYMSGHNARRDSCAGNVGPAGPALKWQAASGAICNANKAVFDVDGVLYFGAISDLFKPTLYAFNPDGTSKLACEITGGVDKQQLSVGAMDEQGVIYLTQASGQVHAVRRDGVQLWTNAEHTTCVGCSNPVISGDDVIYVTGTDTITIQGQTWAIIYLDALAADGSLLWEITLTEFVTDPVLGLDGTIYVHGPQQLHAIGPTGVELWTYDVSNRLELNPVVGSSGVIYCMDNDDNELVAVTASGALAWTYQLPAAVSRQLAVAADGRVCVPCEDGYVYVFNPDGTLLWSRFVGGNSYLALDAAGTVYAASHDGMLYALDASGAVSWWFATNTHLATAPVIGEDGTVYVKDNYYRVYAIGPGGMLPQHTVSGFVTDSLGGGLAAATVSITGEDPVVTDEHGYWTKTLPAGAYIAAAAKDGYDFAPALQPFEVAGGDLALQDFIGGVEAPAAWQMVGRDRAHTRRSPHTGPASPTVLWSHYYPGTWFNSEPAIAGNGTVYYNAERGGTYAFNPDGSLRWLDEDNFGGGNILALGYDDTVYYSILESGTRIFRALSAGGALKWSFALDWSVCSSPVIAADSTIYLCGGNAEENFNRLTALHPDGRLAWQYAGQTDGVVPAVDHNGIIYTIIHGEDDDYACAISPEGAEYWRYPVAQVSGDFRVIFAAVGDDGTIYIMSMYNIYALLPDGTLKWQYVIDSPLVEAPAIGSDGSLFIALAGSEADQNVVLALNPDGSVKWEYSEAYMTPQTALALDAAGVLYGGFAVSDGGYEVRAINPDGTLKWKFDGASSYLSEIAIGPGGELYFGDEGGEVFALGPGQG